MTYRKIATAADLKPWLPSDYLNTGWTDDAITAALTVDQADPRLLAAEIWEEYAATLPEETGEARPVTRWTNLDTSVEYGSATSPRDWALKQAKHHRARAKVKSVPLAHKRIQREEPEGLLDEAPATQKTTTSGPEGQR